MYGVMLVCLFIVEIYKLTKTMPVEEKYGLCSQIQRASVSIASNIAEGTTRISDKEKIRFIEIAYGSLMDRLWKFIANFASHWIYYI